MESMESVESVPVITTRTEECFLSFRKLQKQWLAAHMKAMTKCLNIAYAVNQTDATNLEQMVRS
jgi:hypothetical protein